MSEPLSEKGRLPACRLDKELFAALWALLAEGGELTWQATVGTGDDPLGRQKERPQETVADQDDLFALLAAIPRIDSLQFTAEVAGKGAVSLAFQNTNRPAGTLAVASEDAAWAADRFEAIADLFWDRRDAGADRLYSKLAYPVINSVIPLAAASVLVVVAAVLIIPASIRRSEWLWWITAGTVLATIYVGAKISNKLWDHLLRKYPYIRWAS